MEHDFTAQAQRFVCSAVFCAVTLILGWRLESGVFGVLDVAVTLRFAFHGVASKLCFRGKSQLKWWMGVCSERVESFHSNRVVCESARFGELTGEFWKTSRTKCSLCSLDV